MVYIDGACSSQIDIHFKTSHSLIVFVTTFLCCTRDHLERRIHHDYLWWKGISPFNYPTLSEVYNYFVLFNPVLKT